VVTSGGWVSVVDGATQEFLGKIPVGGFPERAVFSVDSGLLYVTNAESNSVSIIDTRSINASEVLPDSVSASAPLLKNWIGARENRPATGEALIVSVQVTSGRPVATDFVLMIDVRDARGISQTIVYQSGTVEFGQGTQIGLPWTPEKSGDYQIRSFLISDLQSANVLSDVEVSQIAVI
jgi:DNA-binding beta-propeller fold protein YncE